MSTSSSSSSSTAVNIEATAAGVSLDGSSSTTAASSSSSSRARGRWKLLQNAIVGSSTRSNKHYCDGGNDDDDADADAEQYSKRRFPGYGLLQSKLLVVKKEDDSSTSANQMAHWKANLERIATFTTSRQHHHLPRSVQAVRQDIESSVLALWALLVGRHPPPPPPPPHDDGVVTIHLWMDSNPEIYFGRNEHDNQNIDTSSSTTHIIDVWRDALPALYNWVNTDVVSLTVSYEVVVEAVEAAEDETHRTRSDRRQWRLTFSITKDPTATATPQQYYAVRQYQLPGSDDNNNNDHHHPHERFLLTRERQVSSHTKLSLQELVSHRQNTSGGVDNTGNICVWDCALTLAWALQQRSSQQYLPPNNNNITVLELGAGMAAISALSWAVTVRRATWTRIYITDGHTDCVVNNRVNVRLMEAAGLLPDHDCERTMIDCRQLHWTTDTTAPGSQMAAVAADLTLIADCTHFQEYHAALFWTAVQHTAIAGQIWMCQPDRGNSLERFLSLIRVVNETNNNSNNGLLLRVTERHYPTLEEMHQQFLFHNKNNYYDPNLHRPRIFVLTKERDATKHDRQCALQHMRERDGPSTT